MDSNRALSSANGPSRPTPPEGDPAFAAEPLRVLLVDDEPRILEGLARVLRSGRDTWTLAFAHSGAEALWCMRDRSYHVILSDMNMPGMNGAELLGEVAERWPECVRLMLTGLTDVETAVAAVNEGRVFRLLFKPCAAETLRQAIQMALRQYRLQTAERDLLRSRLEHAQRLAVVGEFTAGVVHEVNNMLSVVRSLAATEALFESGRTRSMICEAADRAAELTRELMGFSRRDVGGDVENLDLVPLVKGSAALLRPMLAHHHRLELIMPAETYWVQGHAGRLRQIVSNLVINARDATPRNGLISIELAAGFPAHDEAGVHGRLDGVALKQTRFTRISVRDTGSGMDEETRRRLFEPFFTTKGEGCGTGLGLSVVRQCVEQLRGRIEVESAPGEGAVFHVFVPEVDATKALATDPSDPPAMNSAAVANQP